MTHTSRPDPRTELLHLLSRISFQLGNFTLSSGAASDYYIDCRVTTLHALGARLTGLALMDLFARHKLRPAAVGGLTMGADPVVSSVAIASAERALGDSAAPLVHGFLVRKGEKAHGTRRRIEGFSEQGADVLVVDDVCTTGSSTIEAIEAAGSAGMRVIAAACMVERAESNGRAAVEKALAGAPFLSLYTADDVRAAHIAQMPL